MERPRIHYPAVLVSTLIMAVIGWAWYFAFVSVWLEGAGITEEMMTGMSGSQMGLAYGGSFVAYFVLFYVMAHSVGFAKATTVKHGALTGFWNWLGFTATALFVIYNYQLKPMSLFFVDAGYWLVSMIIGGIILAVWRKKDTTE